MTNIIDIEKSLNNAPELLKDLPIWNQIDSHEIFVRLCNEHNLNPEVITKLACWNREKIGAGRRNGLKVEFDEIFTDEKLWNQKCG